MSAVEFWINEGRKNPICNTNTYPYKTQESQLLDILKKLDFDSVFEIGCGWGRITKLIQDNFDIKTHHACDVSLERTKLVNLEGVITKPFQSIKFDRKYDLVIAIEVLMHIPPEEIKTFIEKTYDISNKHIVTLDYYPKGERFTLFDPFNFIHEYPELFKGKVNHKYISESQSIFHIEK